jgi:hypothetical protein
MCFKGPQSPWRLSLRRRIHVLQGPSKPLAPQPHGADDTAYHDVSITVEEAPVSAELLAHDDVVSSCCHDDVVSS